MAFTARQAQILELAARGRSDKEIAATLGVSVHTVRSHLQRLYQSLGLANRAEAVAAYTAERAPGPAPAAPPPARTAVPRRWLVAGLVAGAILAVADGAGWFMSLTGEIAPATALAGHRAPTPPASPRTGAAATPDSATAVVPAVPQRNTPATAGQAATPGRPGLPVPAPSAPIQAMPATAQLSLVNQERAAAGLPPLAWNACLAQVAAGQSHRMAEQGYLSSEGGVTQDAACRLGAIPPAERLAYWSGSSDTQINAVLFANPLDRADLLGPYRYMGAYWAVGPTGIAFLAVEFA